MDSIHDPRTLAVLLLIVSVVLWRWVLACLVKFSERTLLGIPGTKDLSDPDRSIHHKVPFTP